MQYVFRTVGLVRGKHAYGVIVDDLKKDEQKHTYQWTAMLNGGVWKTDHKGLLGSQIILGKSIYKQNDTLNKQSISPKIGDPLLLVCQLNEDAMDTSSIELSQEPAPPGVLNFRRYERLAIQKTGLKGKFRVLLIPFNFGDALPSITYQSDHALIQWSDGEKTNYSFMKKMGGPKL